MSAVLTPEEVAAGWVAWEGGECPVDPNAMVDAKFRAPPYDYQLPPALPTAACLLEWYHDGENDDIIAYRVIESPRS